MLLPTPGYTHTFQTHLNIGVRGTCFRNPRHPCHDDILLLLLVVDSLVVLLLLSLLLASLSCPRSPVGDGRRVGDHARGCTPHRIRQGHARARPLTVTSWALASAPIGALPSVSLLRLASALHIPCPSFWMSIFIQLLIRCLSACPKQSSQDGNAPSASVATMSRLPCVVTTTPGLTTTVEAFDRKTPRPSRADRERCKGRVMSDYAAGCLPRCE